MFIVYETHFSYRTFIVCEKLMLSESHLLFLGK